MKLTLLLFTIINIIITQDHHDYILHNRDRQQGVRILTAYLYLNDVEAGGGTKFTDLDLTVMPKLGRALFWPSVFNDKPHEKDKRTNHQGTVLCIAFPLFIYLVGIRVKLYASNSFFSPTSSFILQPFRLRRELSLAPMVGFISMISRYVLYIISL
jgi:hypothetical protein